MFMDSATMTFKIVTVYGCIVTIENLPKEKKRKFVKVAKKERISQISQA